MAEISCVRWVLVDFVLVVFLDDVVVVHHNFCCCCVYFIKGDILMPIKLMVVCGSGLGRVEWWWR